MKLICSLADSFINQVLSTQFIQKLLNQLRMKHFSMLLGDNIVKMYDVVSVRYMYLFVIQF